MYYTIGESAIRHRLDVYRENTKYICRIPPAEFEDLIAQLGIDQIESVVLREKRERERTEEQERLGTEDEDPSGGFRK